MGKLLLAVLVGVGLWFVVRQLKGKYAAFSAQRAAIKQQEWAVLENKSAGAYAAVSIIPGTAACSAALSMGDSRILEVEAPSLPLPGCDINNCDCRYQHFSDRRRENRRGDVRREHKILLGALGSDRRGTRDRRKGDGGN